MSRLLPEKTVSLPMIEPSTTPQPPFYVSRRRFEELVAEAMAEIPDQLWNFIENVVVTVEEWPTRRQIESTGVAPGSTLLGLYEGVPLTVRTSHYGLAPPDKITIFRGPILRFCPPDEDAVRSQVRQTVLHEIAHHFGISDQRLIELGAY
jgi:predicted Zn-dependent protease with MMP-like domain